MTWAEFYLLCFAVGFCFSLLSLLSSSAHFHIPHLHGHAVHGGGRGGFGPVNPGTIAAFLAWFGGSGYLLTEYSPLQLFLALAIAVGSGICGAAIVLWFLAKLTAGERDMDPADYDMIGVLGRVSSPVRAGGTGEMIFSREGARRCCAVRADEESAIPRNTEVIVTRYEKGIAYVRRWEELTAAAAGEEAN